MKSYYTRGVELITIPLQNIDQTYRPPPTNAGKPGGVAHMDSQPRKSLARYFSLIEPRITQFNVAFICLPRLRWLFLMEHLHFIPFVSHWYSTGSWNPSSRKTRTCLLYIVSFMTVDDLATQGARASATMICTMLNRIDSASARWGLSYTTNEL